MTGKSGKVRSRAQRSAAAATLLLATVGTQLGCGQKTKLTVHVVTPPGSGDPFASAASAKLTVISVADGATAPTTMTQSAAVSGGKFQVDLDIDAPSSSNYMQLGIDALDSTGATIAHGQTPNFSSQNSEIAVFVNKQGQVGATDLHLPDDMITVGSARGRRELAGAALIGVQVAPVPEPGLGALIVGGTGDDGSLVNEAVLYKTLIHQVIDAGPTAMAPTALTPRRGAVLVASADASAGQQALLWGGAGVGNPPPLPSAADKFDPQVGSLAQVWARPEMPNDDAKTGAYMPAVGQVGAAYLICGGSSTVGATAGDTPLPQAVLVKRNPAPKDSTDQTARLGVTRIPAAPDMTGPMAAARYLHTVTASGDGTAGFVFGGLSATDRMGGKPVAELYAADKSSFAPFMFTSTPAPTSRRAHVAARLKDGRILIAGGYTDDMAGAKTVVGTALIVDLATRMATEVTPFLKTPRYAASISTIAGELVICGGFDSSDKAVGDCEKFKSDSGLPAGDPLPLPNPRGGHIALTVENGLTLLVGGAASLTGPTLSSIDIYTSPPPPASN